MTRKRFEIPSEWIDAYLNRCSENASAPRVSEFACELGVSRVTVNARFQEQTGIPLSEYFASYREQIATDLLAASDLKTEAVALKAGFGTSRTFQRAFARKFGMTPGRYRKLVRDSVN